MKAIIAHGGAGPWLNDDAIPAKDAVMAAVELAYRALRGGAGALDACVAAIALMEDNPLFNAGLGSALNVDGECEMDAAIMIGSSLKAGAVGAVKGVKNPIRLARAVMDETDHVIIVGWGAERLAKALNFEFRDPITPKRRQQLENQLRLKELGPKNQKFIEAHQGFAMGTVGCAVLDDGGEIVVGGSTGGLVGKLPGRLGDTPIVGAGLYATCTGGACATGTGEGIMKVALSFKVVSLISQGYLPQLAAEKAVHGLAEALGVDLPVKVDAGIIAISPDGTVGWEKNTPEMPVAMFTESRGFEVFV